MLSNLLWHCIRIGRWWHKKFALLSAHRNLKAHIIVSFLPIPLVHCSPTYDFALQLPLRKILDLIPCLQSLTVLSSLNYVHILIIILCFRVLHSCYSGPKKLLNWMIIFRYPVWRKITNKCSSHVNAFCMETRLHVAWQRKCDSIPGRGIWFIFSPKHRPATGLIMKPLIQWVLGAVSLGKQTREWCQTLTCISC